MERLVAVFTADWIHAAIGMVMLFLLVAFFYWVLYRGVVLGLRLRSTLRRLTQFKLGSPASVKSKLAEIFAANELRPVWLEYADALHEQTAVGDTEDQVVSLRATAPAETFFNAEVVIDPVMHNEFFRHLPGIFTGIGIIGTFMGLIVGLQGFDASAVEPEALKASLGGLFEHVGNAFLISATAIVLAMFCTISEKFVYAYGVGKLSRLVILLDGLFSAGVGEEYLSRLVQHSREGADQTRQLKESLVEDLKVLLTNLTERQIAATQQLSQDIGLNLRSSLEEPLQKIAETVRTTTTDQSAQAGRMIENLMSGFMTQMKESMGGQMGELSRLMAESAASMSRVELSLRNLVDDLRQTSSDSTRGVHEAMNQLLASLSEHERARTDTTQGMQQQLLSQVQAAVQAMAQAQEASAREMAEAASRASNDVLQAAGAAQQAGAAAMEKASQLQESQAVAVQAALVEMDQVVSRLSGLMGALGGTFERLDGAGAKLAQVHEQARTLTERMETSAGAIRTTSDAMVAASQSLNQAGGRLENASELVASEAHARAELLADLHKVLAQSKQAAGEFSRYSTTVSEGLEKMVDQFGKGTTASLQKNLNLFDTQLANAIGSLNEVITRFTAMALKMDGRR